MFQSVFLVVTVLPESTVVIIRFHTFQFQLCCTVTDKAAAAVLVQHRVHVSKRTYQKKKDSRNEKVKISLQLSPGRHIVHRAIICSRSVRVYPWCTLVLDVYFWERQAREIVFHCTCLECVQESGTSCLILTRDFWSGFGPDLARNVVCFFF